MNRHLALFAALLILADFGARQCAAQARRPVKGGKAPETSIDRDFRPQQLAKLAVIASTDARDLETQSARQRLVEDIFVETLLDRGHVVVARSDIRSVLREQRFAESGLTDDHVVALGKLLNVPAVLVVRITEYALEANFDHKRNNRTQTARATVGVRLISVKTGAIWWQGTHSLSDTVKLQSEQLLVLAQVAERLARAFPEKPKLDGSHFDPEKIDKLALVMVGDSTYSHWDQNRVDQQRLVEDKLGIHLGKRGYALVSRSDLQAVMVEKRFQQSGLTEENISELGKLLNIPAVIVVRITDFETEEYQKKMGQLKTARATMATAALGARLISVETGEVLWCRSCIEMQEVKGHLESSQILTAAAKKIGEMLPQRGSAKKSRQRKSR